MQRVMRGTLLIFGGILVLIFAAIVAVAATSYTHKQRYPAGTSIRLSLEAPRFHGFRTTYFREIIDNPITTEKAGLDLEEFLAEGQPPEFLEYCHRVVERAKAARTDPSAPYDVWAVENGFVSGWPFVSKLYYTRIGVDELAQYPDGHEAFIPPDSRHRIISHQIWADWRGEEPPVLYGGLIANGVFYFLLVPALLLGGKWAIPKIVRMFSAYPAGHCRACGYNLTGNVSGICPECGEQVPEEEALSP